MTPSAENVSRRPLRRVAITTALVAVALAAFGAAIAGSAPDKPYSAFISAPPSATATSTQAKSSVGGVADVGIRLRNDTRQQDLGSANITVPPGVTAQAGSVQLVTPPGGSATLAGNVIQLRNLNLTPGGSAFVTFAAVVPCTAGAADYRFAIAVKQSNDFNGTGNDLNPKNAAPLLSGVGACVPCDEGERCTADTFTSASTASVSGVATSDGDRIRVSLAAPDVPTVDCSGYAESTETVEFDLTNAAGGAAGGLKTVKLQIKKPTKPANQYDLCFRAEDAPAPVLLPDCTYSRRSRRLEHTDERAVRARAGVQEGHRHARRDHAPRGPLDQGLTVPRLPASHAGAGTPRTVDRRRRQ